MSRKYKQTRKLYAMRSQTDPFVNGSYRHAIETLRATSEQPTSKLIAPLAGDPPASPESHRFRGEDRSDASRLEARKSHSREFMSRQPSNYLKALISKQVQSIRKEGHEYALTYERHLSLIRSNCHYCGARPYRIGLPSLVCKNNGIPTNGIDRMDSQVGYTANNCVPCCWPCNRMKLNTGYEDFIARCGMIATRAQDYLADL
jgi:hypothetical protein